LYRYALARQEPDYKPRDRSREYEKTRQKKAEKRRGLGLTARPRAKIEEFVVALANKEVSYSRIALAVHAEFALSLSRNAVAGILARARQNGVTVVDRKPQARAPTSTKMKKEKIDAPQARRRHETRPEIYPRSEDESPASGEIEVAGGREQTFTKTIEDLRAGLCHYPQGGGRDRRFFYCCAQTASIRESYCPEHKARVVAPKGVRPTGRGAGLPRKRSAFSFRAI
jgi:hypothetical protein